MQVQILVLIVVFFRVHVVGYAVPSETDKSLVQFLLDSRVLSSDSDHFYECFNYYTERIDETQKVYEGHYKGCVYNADVQLEAADNATANARNHLYEQIGLSCHQPNICKKQKTALDEFTCISRESASASRKLILISHGASTDRLHLEGQHQMIIFDRDICTTSAQNNLTSQTQKIMFDWSLCITGDITLPTPTTVPPDTTTLMI